MSARTSLARLACDVAASSSRLVVARNTVLKPVDTSTRYRTVLSTSQVLPPLARVPSHRAFQHRCFGSSRQLANDQSARPLIPEASPSSSSSCSSSDERGSIPVTGERTAIGQIEQRLAITFTCTVDECGHRSTHEFSKRSYTKGIVIVQCPGCKNRHLIADNLSWFTDNESQPRTVEQMIQAKGGKVTRGSVQVDGQSGETIEILSS